MNIIVKASDAEYKVDLDKGINISSILSNYNTIKAFYAPDVLIEPFCQGDFIGDIKQGSSVNFKNVRLNPHGNGTHTECVAHIIDIDWPIYKALNKNHFVADLITVEITNINGDNVVTKEAFRINETSAEALIIRLDEKVSGDLSGTNPPYLSIEFIEKVLALNYQHLILELPSIDKEQDGGKVAGHHLFFETSSKPNLHKTITELVDVPSNVADGKYLLEIQIINLDMDASPSRLILYPMQAIAS